MALREEDKKRESEFPASGELAGITRV